jgi:DNA-binding winged helix-turn-helix (wHTH) protein
VASSGVIGGFEVRLRNLQANAFSEMVHLLNTTRRNCSCSIYSPLSARLAAFGAKSVAEAVHSPRVVRFGTFEVDLLAGDLRKSGLKLRLTGQPFHVLAVLLERPGEVVTREELQRRLWPDTFVDVDHNLNTAINKIRDVLGDSAENPRFVETLPRRGYRFIAPVVAGAGLMPAQKVNPQGLLLQAQTGGGEAGREPPLRRHWGVGLSSAAIVVIAVFFYWVTRPVTPPRVSRLTRITNDGHAKSFRIDALPVIVTDGPRLYFAEVADSGMRSALYQVSASGGETSAVPIALEQSVEVGDIASNRSDLLLNTFIAGESEMPLWILPALGGVPRRLGEASGRDAAWSPNGEKIAYANGQKLYVCKPDGTETRELLAAHGPVRRPGWSPSGSVLCSPVGRVATAAGIGLRMGNTTFFNPPLIQGLISGCFERGRDSFEKGRESLCA